MIVSVRGRVFYVDDFAVVHRDVQTIVGRRETVDVVREEVLDALLEKFFPRILMSGRSRLMRETVVLLDCVHQVVQLKTSWLVAGRDEFVAFG